jgi:hypothetical protein
MKLPGASLQGDAHDLSMGIDAFCNHQIQRRSGRHERVEVRHYAVDPEEGTAVKVDVAGLAHNLIRFGNGVGYARKIAGKRSEVMHTAVLSPEEGVTGFVAGQVRRTHHLILVIDPKNGS